MMIKNAVTESESSVQHRAGTFVGQRLYIHGRSRRIRRVPGTRVSREDGKQDVVVFIFGIYSGFYSYRPSSVEPRPRVIQRRVQQFYDARISSMEYVQLLQRSSRSASALYYTLRKRRKTRVREHGDTAPQGPQNFELPYLLRLIIHSHHNVVIENAG